MKRVIVLLNQILRELIIDKPNSSGARIVCVVQATRISARHKKMLQVKVIDTELCGDTQTMFELNSDG